MAAMAAGAAAATAQGLGRVAFASDPFFFAAAQYAAVGAAAYALLFFLSAKLSPRLFPRSYAALPPGDKADWCSRVPSTAHAFASVAWAGALICGGAFSSRGASALVGGATAPAALESTVDGSSSISSSAPALPPLPPSLRACEGSYAALGLSAGYFAADVAAMALYPAIGSFPIYAHHVVAIASLIAAGTAGAAHAPVVAVLASEATTPLVNARFWLDRCGRRQGFLYAANGLALALSWFACRELAFVGLVWWLRAQWAGGIARLPLYARAFLAGVPALLIVLNTLWFFKIVKGARKLWAPFCEGLADAAGRLGRSRRTMQHSGGKVPAAKRRPGKAAELADVTATVVAASWPAWRPNDGGKALLLKHHYAAHHADGVLAAAAAE